jgi:hypothetical protein
MADQTYDFEQFPRGKLPAFLSRRQFFEGIIQEIQAYSQRDEQPFYRLCDLGEMPNAELAWVIPNPVPGSKIFVEDGYAWGKASDSKNGVRLFPADAPAMFVLEQFDGCQNIVDSVRNMAAHLQWDKQRAFAYVRGVFLWLVLAKLYVPRENMKREIKGK